MRYTDEIFNLFKEDSTTKEVTVSLKNGNITKTIPNTNITKFVYEEEFGFGKVTYPSFELDFSTNGLDIDEDFFDAEPTDYVLNQGISAYVIIKVNQLEFPLGGFKVGETVWSKNSCKLVCYGWLKDILNLDITGDLETYLERGYVTLEEIDRIYNSYAWDVGRIEFLPKAEAITTKWQIRALSKTSKITMGDVLNNYVNAFALHAYVGSENANIYFKPITEVTTRTIDWAYKKDYVQKANYYDGILFKTSTREYLLPKTAKYIYTLDNVFYDYYVTTPNVLDNFLNKITQIPVKQFSTTVRGNLAVEVGDIMEIDGDTVLITKRRLEYDGSLKDTFSCDPLEPSDDNVSAASYLEQETTNNITDVQGIFDSDKYYEGELNIGSNKRGAIWAGIPSAKYAIAEAYTSTVTSSPTNNIELNEIYNTGGFSVDGGKVYAPEAGLYFLSANAYISAGLQSGDITHLSFHKNNGSAFCESMARHYGNYISLNLNTLVYLDKNDYISMRAFNQTRTDTMTMSKSVTRTNLSIIRMG